MKKIGILLTFLVLSSNIYSQKNKLPVCTTIKDLKTWENYFIQYPNEKEINWKLFDLYYFQVLFDYTVISLKNIDDGRELIKLCDKYLNLFPNGINTGAVLSLKKSMKIEVQNIEERIKRWNKLQKELAYQREIERQIAYNNSSSSSSSSSSTVSLEIISVVMVKSDYCHGKCDQYLVTFNQNIYDNAHSKWDTYGVKKNQIHVYRFKDDYFYYSSADKIFNTCMIVKTIDELKKKLLDQY